MQGTLHCGSSQPSISIRRLSLWCCKQVNHKCKNTQRCSRCIQKAGTGHALVQLLLTGHPRCTLHHPKRMLVLSILRSGCLALMRRRWCT